MVFIFIELIGDTINVVAQGQRGGSAPLDRGRSLVKLFQKIRKSEGTIHLGIFPGDVQRTVIIGAAGVVLHPGRGKSGNDPMFLRQFVQLPWVEFCTYGLEPLVKHFIPAAVEFQILKTAGATAQNAPPCQAKIIDLREDGPRRAHCCSPSGNWGPQRYYFGASGSAMWLLMLKSNVVPIIPGE